MAWLAFFFALEMGFLPQGDMVLYEADYFSYCSAQWDFYTDLEAEVELFGCAFIGGGVRTSVYWLGDDYTFWPHKSAYRFFAGLRWGPMELGWRHYCIHPTIPMFQYLDATALWEGAYEELYLRVSNRR